SDLIVGLMFTQEEIVETIESQKIDQSIKDEELSNIPSNYNQDVLKENMKSFNNLLQNTSFINWSEARYDKFEFTSEINDSKLPVKMGHGYLYFTHDNVQ